jgi:Arc/MetJ-type ribon-helix-helix transcriptional regulator
MNIRLNSHSEHLLRAQLALGEFRSPEEVIERALEKLAQTSVPVLTIGAGTRSREEAVADLLGQRQGVKLGGLRVKALIHEGHRF